MKTLIVALLASAPIFAQPACVSVSDVIYSVGVSTPAAMNGSLDISLGYSATDGAFVVTQSAARLTIVNGVLSVCLAPGNYASVYSVRRPAPLTGSVTSTRYWVIPSSGGPYTVAQVETSVAATPALTVALSQLGGGGATNGQVPVWSTAQQQWVPGAGGGSVAVTSGQIPYGTGSAITSSANITRQGTVIAAPPVVVAMGPSGAATWCYVVVGYFGNNRYTAASSPACVTGTLDGINNSITAPSAHDGIVGYVAYLTTAGAGGHIGLVDYPDPDATIFDTAGIWTDPRAPTAGVTEGITLGTPDRINNGNLIMFGQIHSQGLITGVTPNAFSPNDPNIINNFSLIDLGLTDIDAQGAVLTSILFGMGPEGPMVNVAGLINVDVNVGDSQVTAGVGPPVIIGERIHAQAENPDSNVTFVTPLDAEVIVAGPVSGTATGISGTADNTQNASAMAGKLFGVDAPTVDAGLGATAGAALIHGGTVAANPTGARYGVWIEDTTALNLFAGPVKAGAYQSSDGSAGLTTTKTVRAAGGASDCTLIYKNGLLVGGSC